jgi:hypothetical protein
MYLNNSKILNEPFADTTVSYTDADKNKILQVLKDTYEVDALLNITQIAKGLQTDGYTVPGKLNVSGNLKTSGDLEVSGNIKIGKYSLTPNKIGNDDMLELKYTKDGTEQNNKTIARFGKEGGDKMQVCVNDDCSKYFFINGADPNLGFYSNKQGETGFIGKASVDIISTNNVTSNNISTNNIKKLATDQTRIRLIDNETNICGDADCNKKQFFVKYGEGNARAGIQSDTSNSEFELINKSDRKYKIKTYEQTFEIGPAKKDNSWYNATIIHDPTGNDRFKVCSRPDCGQHMTLWEADSNNIRLKLNGPQSDETSYEFERKDGRRGRFNLSGNKVYIDTRRPDKNGGNWDKRDDWGQG